ncbi:MAG: tyrosine-type recombinase/integrase [Armatimonadota bacterium]
MAEAQKLARLAEDARPPDGPIHYEEVLERFLASKDSPHTRAQYRRCVRDFFERVGETDICAIDGDSIIRYDKAMRRARKLREEGRAGGLAPDTIRARIYSVRSFLRFCYAYGLTPHLSPERVAEFTTVPRARELTQRDVLDREEARALLQAASDEPRDHALIMLMLQSGLRVSEAAQLRRRDVYDSAGRYWVEVNAGKGDKQREVEIPRSAFEMVQQYRREAPGADADPLFTSRKGGFMTRVQIYRLVRRYALKAGIGRPVSPHTLRHTYANHQRLLGERLEVLALQLGHTLVETTRRYTQPARLRTRRPVKDWMAAETPEEEPARR